MDKRKKIFAKKIVVTSLIVSAAMVVAHNRGDVDMRFDGPSANQARASESLEVNPAIKPAIYVSPLSAETLRNREFSIESQCGASWDAQQVESYDGASGPAQSFVSRHETRVGYHVDVGCSGTLISDDLFLSAGHCGYAVGHRVRFDYQNSPQGILRAQKEFTVAQVLEQENNTSWDYSIVRLNGSPGREFGHANIAATDPANGSRLTIIGHPAGRPKEIHAGPLLDYASAVGSSWFRHQVDTVGGNSGSGVLNDDGELIGVHTNAGCNVSVPIQGNSAMRMTSLVTRSPILQSLTRNRILWRNTNGNVSLWLTNAVGDLISGREYAPGNEWTTLGMTENRILWRHNDSRAVLWVLDETGNITGSITHGPYPGWTPVSYANNRIVWRHNDGRVSLWNVDSNGNLISGKEYGPYAGWVAASYGNNRLLWRTESSGQAWLWQLDDADNFVNATAHTISAGWSVQTYNNGEMFWRHSDGTAAIWSMNRAGQRLTSVSYGPHSNWTPMSLGDRKLLWRNTDGSASYWTVNSDGAFKDVRTHGPYAGWTPMLTAGITR